MSEEHCMYLSEVFSNVGLIRAHFWVLLEKPAQRSLQQAPVIAVFNQRMTDSAGRPIAHALPDNAGNCISNEVLRRIPPYDIRLRTEITYGNRHKPSFAMIWKLSFFRSSAKSGWYGEAKLGADLLLCAAGPADVLPRLFDGNGQVVLTAVAPCGSARRTLRNPVPARSASRRDVIQDHKTRSSCD